MNGRKLKLTPPLFAILLLSSPGAAIAATNLIDTADPGPDTVCVFQTFAGVKQACIDGGAVFDVALPLTIKTWEIGRAHV